MKLVISILFTFCIMSVTAQELYVFSEPASNMPARSIGLKYSARFQKGYHSGQTEQRHIAEIMYGANKNLMLHLTTTFSDMYTADIRWESIRGYAKYRFLSTDDVYKHFRMAAYGELSYSKVDRFYDELSMDGDVSAVQAGIIATQLLHKLAVSSTVGYVQSIDPNNKVFSFESGFPDKALNYSLSAGLLLLPKEYVDYKQTNVNLYVELLGQQGLDKNRYYVDIAPALQFIFNSQAKLNLGYRSQLNGNMHRMAKRSVLVSLEWLFLNAFK
jgi:hypothetical protein